MEKKSKKFEKTFSPAGGGEIQEFGLIQEISRILEKNGGPGS